jgi:hypothetical protein
LVLVVLPNVETSEANSRMLFLYSFKLE